MAGLWLLSASLAFLAAVSTKAWVFLGWAIPLGALGLCQPLIHNRGNGVWLGMTFIAIALFCSLIQAWQVHGMEQQHDSN